jgi:serine phosphatase RsbU (regulator of sigma subunit)
MRYVSAGHPPPLIAGRPLADLARNGPPVGVVRDAQWDVSEVELPPTTSVLLHTDGLVEGLARPESGERLGVEPIQRALDAMEPAGVGEPQLRGLVELATEANGAGLPDDVALLALNLRPG